MDEIDKSNGCFLTFRAHMSEPDVFEDFLHIFLPIVTTKFPNHIYSVEKDDSPDRHLHLFFLHNEKETKNIKQKLYPKAVKDFFKSLNSSETTMKNSFLIGRKFNQTEEESFGFKMTLEDKMKAIAYCGKDICRRQVINHISQEVITTSCKFYYSTEKRKPSTEKGWKIINGKNFHIKLEEYSSKNNMTVHDYELIPKMTHDRHTFQLTAREQKKYIAELRFAHKEYNLINDEVLDFMEYEDQNHPYIQEQTDYIHYLKQKLNHNGIEFDDIQNYK